MADLLSEKDRRALYDTLLSMFGELGADRFTILALTPGGRALVCSFHREGVPRDISREIAKVLFAMLKDPDHESLIFTEEETVDGDERS